MGKTEELKRSEICEMKKYKDVAIRYARECAEGEIPAGRELVQACRRFLDDLDRDDLELRTHDTDLAINIVQTTLVHAQGEDFDGNPLLGKPFLLQPWQIFIIYSLFGFYYRGTNERRYKEVFTDIKHIHDSVKSMT